MASPEGEGFIPRCLSLESVGTIGMSGDECEAHEQAYEGTFSGKASGHEQAAGLPITASDEPKYAVCFDPAACILVMAA